MKHSWHDEHVPHSGKSLLKALYATIGIFIFLFVFFHISSAFYTSHLSETLINKFKSGIAEDTAYLKNQGDIVSKNNLLITSLLNKDRDSLLKIIKEEISSRSIGLIGVTDSRGVIMGRTFSPGRYGDNVFLTVPAGRRVSQGKSVESIEMTGFNNQIFMTTARPIMQDEKMVGALFANYLLDDQYASRFKDKYFSSGAQVVFYTKNYGVYGDSFTDQNTRKLIYSYFNTGSDWVKDGVTDKTFVFDDGTSYLVENIVFPGLDQSPGGALIFIPRRDISGTANIITAIFTLCIFLFLAIRLHFRMSQEERSWRYYIMLVGVSIPVFILSFFALYAQNIGRLHLERIPYTLYNSTIHLQPESGIYSLNSQQFFTVTVETGDEPINAVQAKIKFDPNIVEIKSIDMSSSTCSYVVQNIIDQNAGTATISCIILNPQNGQQAIPIANVYVSPLKPGTFTLSFDKTETKVIAADGLGTDVLRVSQDGSYRVDNFDTSLNEDSSGTSTGRTFIVFSPTHPNESRWYNSGKADFIWRGKPNAVYHYSFDSSPDTIPTDEHVTQGNQASVAIPGDGIYYFHLQLASGGPIAHYEIRSDMTPPVIISLDASKDRIFVGDVVRFSFNATDPTSGIQRNYYVDLGNHLFLPIGQELFVPFLVAGDQDLKLRVYDNAGNYSEKVQIIHVENK